jgi:hypothetical protein
MTQPRASCSRRHRRATLVVLAVFFSAQMAAGCSFSKGAPVQSATARPYVPSEPLPSPTFRDTPTPLPSKVILVASAEDKLALQLDPVLESLASQSGLVFERSTNLPTDLGDEHIHVVIFTAPINELAGLAGSSPRTQFVGVGVQGLSPNANLTVLEPLTDRPDEVAFLGGYLAALVSEDWRVASISQADSAVGATTRLAFANGAVFFCGLCRPSHPPYAGYPLDYQVPSSGGAQAVDSVLAAIGQDRVEIVFVQPGLDDPGLDDGLTERGVRVIGFGVPASGAPPSWIASIQEDVEGALTSVWPDVAKGESAGTVTMPMRVSVYDPVKLTPGRVQLAQTTIDDLENGFIDTGVDPLTGAAR